MTEKELNHIRQQARTGDAEAECELAIAYSRDYFRYRAIYTLRALYKEVLAVLNNLISQKCQPSASERLEEYIETFRQSPSRSTLDSLIASIIADSSTCDGTPTWKITQELQEAIGQVSPNVPTIMETHFPEWHHQEGLKDAVTAFTELPNTDSLTTLLSEIYDAALKSGDNALIIKLLTDSALKGYHPALQELGRRHKLQTKGIARESNWVYPVMAADGNEKFPSIATGKYHPAITVNGRSLSIPKTIPFFNPDSDMKNRFIIVSHDENSFESRKSATACIETLLASIMAWAGPHAFSIDVIDFVNSGIGASLTPFLPAKEIKVLPKAEDWDRELASLNSLLEKRTSQFSNFIHYNSANPGKKEPLKIVVIQDLSGDLIEKWPDKENDQEQHEAYKEHLRQVKQYTHLLECGFKFGFIFIINTSKAKVYPTTEFCIDCITDTSKPQNPFDCLRIEGINERGANWLLRYMAGGESPTYGKRQTYTTTEVIDDDALTTILSEENTDAEFRMDTVSHTHAFIIGKTGSGKSVLLHNIITGLITRYGPEDLMLYLLDLKMGGVEFNRYRRLPHLRSLLVDNSDIQIVQEIMYDIEMMMRERGKAFRNAGVSNIKEYNRAHPRSKMAKVLVVIDECHQIFSMGNGSSSSKEQQGITERLAKIAKEGRSQGIHLIFATQTLSGSEIPPDIQKNITDYYLLKCSPTDSETLVRGSSNKTEALPVGKVYYYHSDRQSLFQGIYTDANECKRIINEVVERNKGKNSHGQFYFNGAQTFALNEDVIGAISNNRNGDIRGAVGRKINLQQDIVNIDLKANYAENILISGINSEGQLERTSMALLASQLIAVHCAKTTVMINVIDCSLPGSDVSRYLQDLEHAGWISLCGGSASERILKELCEQVQRHTVPSPTMLYIIGQERYTEMKRDLKFSNITQDTDTGITDSINMMKGLNFSESTTDSADFGSYKNAVCYLLDNGPSAGVHIVIQLDKVDKLLFNDYITGKIVSEKFKHIILLRSSDNVVTKLGLDDGLKPNMLSADPERLRAYCYNDDNGENILFSPFERMKINDLKTIINSLKQ